ncbi:hypothetical protein LIP81_19160, partial [Erysipelatoclostridium ramosum]|nr:hypothetical protein [Thomasclavelia ramosa]
NSWRGWLVLAFAAAGVIGACIPFIARFFAFGLPAGRAVWILLLQMAVATVLFVISIWVFSRFLPKWMREAGRETGINGASHNTNG